MHEDLLVNPTRSALHDILQSLLDSSVTWKGQKPTGMDCFDLEKTAIYTEVALIRDAYHARKPDILAFMDELVGVVKRQEGITDCRLFSELPEELRNPNKTHPKQIRHKGQTKKLLTNQELRVFGSVQGMFNAKPDLAIVAGNYLIVVEAKFTEAFSETQLYRTRAIAEVWAEILHKDFGLQEPPTYAVAKLGDAQAGADVSWQKILDIARNYYPEQDRTRVSMENAVILLRRIRS